MDEQWEQTSIEAEAERIVVDINRQGYGSIENYISEDELAPVRAIAHGAVQAAGDEYVCFTGPDDLPGTVLEELPRSLAFKQLCRRIYELGTGVPGPEVSFYQIFRCLQGASGQVNSYYFHYDSYVLTALLPVEIPQEGRAGDLLVIPNTRRIRQFYLSNLLDKILVDNKLTQIVLGARARRRKDKFTAIQMKPGNMYFFWGYRSVHTNEPCDPDKLRATALFHYGDPHADSSLREMIRRAKGMR